MRYREKQGTHSVQYQDRRGLQFLLQFVICVGVISLIALFVVGSPNSASAQSNTRLDAVKPITSPQGFTHPGVFVTLDELKASKKKVQAGEAPWSTIFNQLSRSNLSTRTVSDFSAFRSAANPDVPCSLDDPSGCVASCGWYNNPDFGCTIEQNDAKSVYAQALMYWYTGDDVYAQRAIETMHTYIKHFKGHRGSNGPLVNAWVTSLMVKGAELIRYTYVPAAGDVAFDVEGFSELLRDVYVERLVTFDWYGVPTNWMGSGIDGMMNAAVFLDDRNLYNQAVSMWREYARSYLYISSDGEYPNYIEGSFIHNYGFVGVDTQEERNNLKCYWLRDKVSPCQETPRADPGRVVFQHGQAQETCRDMYHAGMGIAGVINVAETARIHGADLYGEQQERIMAAVTYAVQIAQSYSTHGWPTDFCHGAEGLDTSTNLNELSAEVAYNAYALRKGAKFSTLPIAGYNITYPNNDPVSAFIASHRSTSNVSGLVTSWETLTHHHIAAYIDDPDDGGTDTPTPNPGGSSGPGEDNVPGAPNTGHEGSQLPRGMLLVGGTLMLLVAIIIRYIHQRAQRGVVG